MPDLYNDNMNNFMCVDRIAFSLFGYEVYWYGLIICTAIIVAVGVAMYYCKLKKYETDIPINIALVILPTGILSARLFAVLFDSDLSLGDFFNFRTGGMSIIGAVVGGGLSLLIFCLIKDKKITLKYFDVLAVVLLLAQAIGRWGNYFNSEVYGQVISSDSIFATFPFAVKVDGVFYQALFFYEFVLNTLAFGIISVVFIKYKNNGYATALYLIFYGVIRTCLEPLRQGEYILRLAGFPISRIFSVGMIVVGIILYVSLILYYKKYRSGIDGEKATRR